MGYRLRDMSAARNFAQEVKLEALQRVGQGHETRDSRRPVTSERRAS